MLDVFLTINTHVGYSAPGHNVLPFAERYLQKVYGISRDGNCALPLLLKLLREHGLRASFFVESLFAVEYGLQPLQELVELINEGGQDIQLLLDAQWAMSMQGALLESLPEQTSHLSDYTQEQQIEVVKIAKRLLMQSGVKDIQAFREVKPVMSKSVLNALVVNNIIIDCSFDPSQVTENPDFLLRHHYNQPFEYDNVVIYPVTVFKSGKKQQITVLNINSCCFNEIETVLNHASTNHWDSVVMTLSSDMLMTPGQVKLDPVKFNRMKTLCAYLAGRNDFNVRGFNNLEHRFSNQPFDPPQTQQIDCYRRWGEQFVSAVI